MLVHCQAGVSRSATLVIAWLMAKERLGADAATAVVSAARSIIWPNGG
jgi:protein-tyrosine phosphatase